jgi:hypothetical protein
MTGSPWTDGTLYAPREAHQRTPIARSLSECLRTGSAESKSATPVPLDLDRLLVVARFGEIDAAQRWNTRGLLGRLDALAPIAFPLPCICLRAHGLHVRGNRRVRTPRPAPRSAGGAASVGRGLGRTVLRVHGATHEGSPRLGLVVQYPDPAPTPARRRLAMVGATGSP